MIKKLLYIFLAALIPFTAHSAGVAQLTNPPPSKNSSPTAELPSEKIAESSPSSTKQAPSKGAADSTEQTSSTAPKNQIAASPSAKQDVTVTPADRSLEKQNQAPAEDDADEMPTPSGSSPDSAHYNYSKQFTATLIAILIILLLVLLVIWIMRRFSTNRPIQMNHRKHIKILERRPLSPNTYVYLVQVGDKQFVIAESKFQVHNVATLDWNETEPDR